MSGLAGRVAIVTGGLSGIGAAVARELAGEGAQVAVGSRRGGEAPDGIALSAPLDVRDPASADGFVARVAAELGTPDILVNAAGIMRRELVEGHDERHWTEMIETNLNGPFRMIRAVLPGMKALGCGAIVNIASTSARTATADTSAYSAAKAGLVGLTQGVALEGAPHGITCVAVSPTWVETPMLHESARRMARENGTSAEDEVAAIRASNPQNRLVQPDEIAALVAFLCSGRAPGLTMEDIQVNAGALW